MPLEKRNIFSSKFEKKSTDELKRISVSQEHQETAKLATIWELEKREGVSKELAERASSIQEKEEQRKEENKAAERFQTTGPRFVAAVIDLFLFIGCAGLVGVIPVPAWITSLFGFIAIGVPYFYSVFMHAQYGQTLGKMAMSIKVIDYAKESRITMKQAFLRDIGPVIYIMVVWLNILFMAIYRDQAAEAVVIVIMILQIVYWGWTVMEIVSMLFDDKSRSIPDYIAGTVVVRE